MMCKNIFEIQSESFFFFFMELDFKCRFTLLFPVDLDGNPKALTPCELSDGSDPISPSPENGYHSNSSTIEDSDSDENGSLHDEEDDHDIPVKMAKKTDDGSGSGDDVEKDLVRKNGLHHHRHHRPDGILSLEEYMNRSDTAIIYPEPVEDMDGVNGDTDVEDPDSPGTTLVHFLNLKALFNYVSIMIEPVKRVSLYTHWKVLKDIV